jgi:hypothetical protein
LKIDGCARTALFSLDFGREIPKLFLQTVINYFKIKALFNDKQLGVGGRESRLRQKCVGIFIAFIKFSGFSEISSFWNENNKNSIMKALRVLKIL